MSEQTYKNPKGAIVDYFGFPLKPGDIVVYGYRGQTCGEPFSCGVFIKENKNTLTIAKYGVKFNRKTKTIDSAIKKSAIGKNSNLMQSVIIVSNPLFSLENGKIRKALELIESLKSNGTLPADFKAGVTNSLEYSDEE